VPAAETDALKIKKAWEIAIAPAKQIPMNAIMMYMSGNSLQIFSIMMVFMLFKGPIQGLLGTNSVFAKFDSEGTRTRLIGVKIVYVLVQFGLLGLGVWKVNGMGLLPYVASRFSLDGRRADSTGRRGRIGWRGNRNGCLWNRLILLLGEYETCNTGSLRNQHHIPIQSSAGMYGYRGDHRFLRLARRGHLVGSITPQSECMQNGWAMMRESIYTSFHAVETASSDWSVPISAAGRRRKSKILVSMPIRVDWHYF
jgi:hypothetical protein